jgi:hypothetical protein
MQTSALRDHSRTRQNRLPRTSPRHLSLAAALHNLKTMTVSEFRSLDSDHRGSPARVSERLTPRVFPLRNTFLDTDFRHGGGFAPQPYQTPPTTIINTITMISRVVLVILRPSGPSITLIVRESPLLGTSPSATAASTQGG